MKKSCICLVLALMIIGLGPMNSNAIAETTSKRDSIIVALSGEPTSMDEQVNNDGMKQFVTKNVTQTLMGLNGETFEPEYLLATSHKVIDEVTWEFELRENVEFHHGDTFSADDVVFSLNRVREFNSNMVGYTETIKEIQVVDSNTIRIVTIAPDPILLKRLLMLPILGAKWTAANSEQSSYTPDGTGPYMVVEFNRGLDIQMIAFENYWGPKPQIKKASYRIIKEASTRLAALQKGEVDLAINMYPEYKQDMPKTIEIQGNELFYLKLNCLRGPFQNPDLRLALAYAINVPEITEYLYLGSATQLQGQMGKQSYTGFSDKVGAYPFDLEKAKELMDKAGYNGEPIEIIGERGRWLKDGELNEALLASMTAAGFNVKLKFVSWSEFIDMMRNPSKMGDLMTNAIGNDFLDMDRPYSAMGTSTGPMSANKDPVYDEMVLAAKYEMDVAKRQEKYDEIAAYTFARPYAIPLFALNDIYGAQEYVEFYPREDGRLYLAEISFTD